MTTNTPQENNDNSYSTNVPKSKTPLPDDWLDTVLGKLIMQYNQQLKIGNTANLQALERAKASITAHLKAEQLALLEGLLVEKVAIDMDNGGNEFAPVESVEAIPVAVIQAKLNTIREELK